MPTLLTSAHLLYFADAICRSWYHQLCALPFILAPLRGLALLGQDDSSLPLAELTYQLYLSFSISFLFGYPRRSYMMAQMIYLCVCV